MVFSSATAQRSMASMNITPLVDVMLVLLVIFMIAAPLMSRSIPLDLPQVGPPNIGPTKPPEPIDLRIDASGEVFWNDSATPAAALEGLMRSEMTRDPDNAPVLQIDASGDADYAVIVKVLAAANGAGLDRIGFVRH